MDVSNKVSFLAVSEAARVALIACGLKYRKSTYDAGCKRAGAVLRRNRVVLLGKKQTFVPAPCGN